MTLTLATGVWLALLITFVVIEAVTFGLVSVWFAIGAAAAMVVSAFGVDTLWQAAVFLVVSGVCMLALRKAAQRRLTPKATPTNAELNVGRLATVIAPVCPTQAGRVRLDGVDWIAKSSDTLAQGALCRVVAVDGATLTVAADGPAPA